MKLIKVYIRLDMFKDVRRAFNKEGYTSMTVMEAEGMGSYSDPENRHGSLKFPALHSKVVKLEMVSEADHVDAMSILSGKMPVQAIKATGLWLCSRWNAASVCVTVRKERIAFKNDIN